MNEILSSLGPIFTVGLVFILVIIFFSFVPLGLWITAFFSGVKVGIATLVGMKLRRVAPRKI
ncbi:MAG: flotillin-like FloA family protein, partial [Ezakiella coagulans]